MTDISMSAPRRPGLLIGTWFDVGFIGGIAALALVSGAVVLVQPSLFPIVLMLDVWLLGYHHVISTFTRLCFDKQSAKENRFLIVELPILVLIACVAAGWGIGFWVLGTTYLYWQWFHYTRQSWGVSQVYRRKAEGTEMEGELFLKLVFYLLPATGILYRSYTDPDMFLGLEIKVLPVPGIVVVIFAAATIVSLGAWFASRIRMFFRGTLPGPHTAYMISHFVIFLVGYILIGDITIGWLVINVWHNAQYVLFVWVFNNKKYSKGIDQKAKFLSSISQTRNWPYYFMVCAAMSTIIYMLIEASEETLANIALPAIIIYQTINFHHYIVDSVIWKARKKPMRETLGLKA